MALDELDLAVRATLDTTQFERAMEAMPAMAEKAREKARRGGRRVTNQSATEDLARQQATYTQAIRSSEAGGLISSRHAEE